MVPVDMSKEEFTKAALGMLAMAMSISRPADPFIPKEVDNYTPKSLKEAAQELKDAYLICCQAVSDGIADPPPKAI